MLASCPPLSAAGPGISADEALKRLMDGNARYLAELKDGPSRRNADSRAKVAESQYPHSIILGCADSRVAPEVFFDAGIGDLFVVRVAGNTISAANYGVMGSLEYAVAVLKVPLLMVMGHENCGAVDAAIKTIHADTELPGSIESLVEAIRPAAREAKGQAGDGLHNAIVANVKLTTTRLTKQSGILEEAVSKGQLKIVGSVYDLKSGAVKLV